MKCILFARVSSKEQEETGFSLPSQIKLLNEYALNKELEVVKEFSISESANGKSQREAFKGMLEFVKKEKITAIICEKVDRLTRNLKDAVQVNEWINQSDDREVHFVKENCVLSKESRSNEKFIWNIKVSVAQYYIDNLSEEVKKGQKEKLAQGWLPTAPYLGYKTVGEKGHKIHIVDEDVAPYIRKAFKLYSDGGYSLQKLSDLLYEDGFRTRKNNRVSKSNLARLLSKHFYYGKIMWKGEMYEGKHEPLVSKALFDEVQDRLARKSTPKYSKHSYLFKGMITCQECGGLITWEMQKNTIYGHCNGYRECSQKTWAKEPEIERQISSVFSEFQVKSERLAKWIHKALKESHKEEIEYHEKTQDELAKRLVRVQQRLDRLYDDKLDGEIDREMYQRKFKQYSEEKDAITTKIDSSSKANTKYLEMGANIFDLSQRAEQLYLDADKDQKRELLSLVFNKVELNEGQVKYDKKPIFKILSKAVQETNSSKLLQKAQDLPNNFEPARNNLNKTKNRTFDETCSSWLQVVEEVRTEIVSSKQSRFTLKSSSFQS